MTDDAMKTFRSRFVERCGRDLASVEAIEKPLGAAEQRAELIRIAHSISGSAGIFGFADLGDAASRLEQLLVEESPGDADQIGASRERLVAALKAAIAAR